MIVFFESQCTDKLERDRLVLFLNKLILNQVGALSTQFVFYEL